MRLRFLFTGNRRKVRVIIIRVVVLLRCKGADRGTRKGLACRASREQAALPKYVEVKSDSFRPFFSDNFRGETT